MSLARTQRARAWPHWAKSRGCERHRHKMQRVHSAQRDTRDKNKGVSAPSCSQGSFVGAVGFIPHHLLQGHLTSRPAAGSPRPPSLGCLQVQSKFFMSCVSKVTVSRLVPAIGCGFVISGHLSAAPSGAGWVQEVAGDPGLAGQGREYGEEDSGTPLGWTVQCPLALFPCGWEIHPIPDPALPDLQGHQPGSLSPEPRILPPSPSPAPQQGLTVAGGPRHCSRTSFPSFGLAGAGFCPLAVTCPLGLGAAAAPPGGLCKDKGLCMLSGVSTEQDLPLVWGTQQEPLLKSQHPTWCSWAEPTSSTPGMGRVLAGQCAWPL